MTPHEQLEVINQEAVVTSFIREGMPVVRYRTGDKVEWVHGECECGANAPRFKLLGRMDSQINIWACRLPLSDIEAALIKTFATLPDYQVLVESVGADERLTIRLKESSSLFIQNLYDLSHDLQKTISLLYLTKWLSLDTTSSFSHNPRTGKIPRLLDQR
jgi:phenylacetate-CoA ligase